MTISVANVTTAGNTVYTSSGNTVVTYLSLCNYGNASVNIDIYVVPNSGGSVGTASNNNIAITSLELTSNATSSGDTYQFYVGNEKLIFSNNDSIQITANANTVTAITSYTSA
jgi:hypothetical protein